MAKRWTCDHCGTRNEDSAVQCSGCGLLRGSVVPAGSAGAPPPSPATPPSRPGAQWSSDPLIAEEAREWQAEQRSAQQLRGFGGRPTTVVLAILVVIWLALCGVAVALTVGIVMAGGGEALIFLPPMYCVLSAVGTGLVIDIRSRFLGRGPSVGRIVGSVFSGAIAALIVGSALAVALILGVMALGMALFGDDTSNWHPVAYAGFVLAAFGTVFPLPVIAGIGGVLYYVSEGRRPGRTLMRRVLGLIGAIVLAGSLASSSLAVEPVGQPDMFVGSFEEISQQTGAVVSTVNTEIRRPTTANLVPGKLDAYGPNGEFHAIFARSSFWYDPDYAGGSRVASAEGVGCGFFKSGAPAFCSEYVVMAIDVDDPAVPDQFAFALERDSDGGWIWNPSRWYDVGKGSFVLHYIPQ